MIGIKPKVEGRALVTHRCYVCRQPITPPAEPVFEYRTGLLVAVHPEHTGERHGSRSETH